MAALSAAASLVRHGRGTGPFWIVATIGEEGMSNLTGIRHAIATVTNPGGEAINARARDAWFEVDLRADSMRPLQELEDRARQVIRDSAPGFSAEVEDLGRRPAGSGGRAFHQPTPSRRCPPDRRSEARLWASKPAGS